MGVIGEVLEYGKVDGRQCASKVRREAVRAFLIPRVFDIRLDENPIEFELALRPTVRSN